MKKSKVSGNLLTTVSSTRPCQLVLACCLLVGGLACFAGCYVPNYHRPHGFSDTSNRRFAAQQPMAVNWHDQSIGGMHDASSLPPAPAEIEADPYGPDLLPIPVEPKQIPADAVDDERSPVDLLPNPSPSAKRIDPLLPTSAGPDPAPREPGIGYARVPDTYPLPPPRLRTVNGGPRFR